MHVRARRYTSDAVRCLEYSLHMGADITLNSYGGLYADSQSLQAAIAAAEAAGQLFVTAAGNDYGACACGLSLCMHHDCGPMCMENAHAHHPAPTWLDARMQTLRASLFSTAG